MGGVSTLVYVANKLYKDLYTQYSCVLSFLHAMVTVQSGNIAHLRYFMPGLTSNINTDEHHLPLDVLLIQLLKYHDMKCWQILSALEILWLKHMHPRETNGRQFVP